MAPSLRSLAPLREIKKETPHRRGLLRREDSNFRPSGYEPDELPLLYFAMWSAKVTA